MTEKRKFRRLPVPSIACRIYQDFRLIDLSIGGAFVESPHPLPAGTEAKVEFSLPSAGGRRVTASVRVEWAGDYFAGRGTPCFGMGLSFTSVAPEDRLAITEFLRKAYDLTRGALRVQTRLAVKFKLEGRSAEGLVRELCERSLFIETNAVASLGAEVELALSLPNATWPVAIRGVVLRVEPASEEAPAPPEGNGARGLRIEFRDLSIAARELIKSYLDDVRGR